MLVCPYVVPRSSVGPTYPASVVANGLQAVWDLRRLGSATPGPRTAITKTLGVDNLPGGNTTTGTNCTYDGTNLIITGNQTFNNWNFQITGAPFQGVVVRGNLTTVTFNDCIFGTVAVNPAVDNNHFYGLQASDNATSPSVNCNYCKFDGGRRDSNIGIRGPWSSSALYALSSSTVIVDHCHFTGIPYDAVKTSNAFYTQTWCLIEAFPWNLNADADGIQMISGSIDVENCLYDLSEGDGTHIFNNINQAIFCTIDTDSTGNGIPTVKNNIFYGFGLYASFGGNPNTVVSVADNHTAGAQATGFHIVNGVWQGNVFQPGRAGTWTVGPSPDNHTSAGAIASWTRNLNFDTGATIAAPSF